MQYHAFLIVLALLGLIDSAYIYIKTRTGSSLVCPINFHCEDIVTSKWSTTFGINNTILGILFYAGVLFGTLFGVANSQFSEIIFKLIFYSSAFGLCFSAYLTYIQIYKIKNFCLYCLISAIITLLIFITSLLVI